MSAYYLGIDGGQSSTTALIADATGKVVGRGRGGPCNHVSGDEAVAKFTGALDACVSEACTDAGLQYGSVEFAAACFGFSGGTEDKEALARQLIRSAKYKFVHDAYVALAGATAGEPGIVAIGGTGSMAFGRNAEGATARAGGWGYVFGDEGGAFDIVRRALRAALRSEEGWGAETKLRKALLDTTHSESADGLMHRFYSQEFSRQKIAALAPIVTDAAGAGDEVALGILLEGAEALTTLIEGVYNQLFPQRDRVQISYIGGVFRSEPLRVAFEELVMRKTECEVIPPRFTPVSGAVLEALRLDGNLSALSNLPPSHK